MMTRGGIPTDVLSQSIEDAIAGRRVRAGVFTTYTFDPGFFELHVLPLLFDQSFSHVDKVRRIQLEDALYGLNDLAVYYDRMALAPDAEPAQLDYRRIDVRRRTGCFHPKVALLLVDEKGREPDDSGEDRRPKVRQSLIVAILSANLTRGGWWESVECAHIQEIRDYETDGSRCSFRGDLIQLITRIRECADEGEDHGALDTIHRFLLQRTQTWDFAVSRWKDRFLTRIFFGQQQMTFAQWLADLGMAHYEWNLEVISPFFDASGARPLEDLVNRLKPRKTLVYLPRDNDGTALVSADAYKAIGAIATWSDLPWDIVAREGRQKAESLPPRYVHAKVYRFWSKNGPNVLVVGSVNLTTPAHSHAAAGNMEAAFLLDGSEKTSAQWWLQPAEREARRFAEKPPAEDEPSSPAFLDLSLRYDWATHELFYRLTEKSEGGFTVLERSGRVLFHIEAPRIGKWTACPADAASRVEEILPSTSFVDVEHAKGRWRLLVREENMSHRPSLLRHLTPEEILEYWSLLTPEQRADFVERREGGEVEGIPVASREPGVVPQTLFDRFAGLFHSFGCLRRSVDESIGAGRLRDAEALLLGAKYDSLPSLLQKTIDRQDADPVMRYATFLCARQVWNAVARNHREFVQGGKPRAAALESLLARLDEVRKAVPTKGIKDADAFFSWYEKAFLRELAPGGSKR